jgi:DNA repair protein RecO (recombination protein O)
LLLFAQEVFNRTLREESPDAGLFGFVEGTLEALDTGDDPAHQPLILLVGLCKHLGFSPEAPSEGETRFDLREGCFFRGEVPHEFCMEPGQSSLFARILTTLEAGTRGAAPFTSSPVARRCLLDDLLVYYRLHVDGFGELRSLDVLRAVLA